MKKQYEATHFAVEDIIFYGMDEDNDIVCDENGNAIKYRIKDGVRFKPLEYLCEDLQPEELEVMKGN